MEKLDSIDAQIRALETKYSGRGGLEEASVYEFELMSLQHLLGKHASITVVFSAVAVEAYIYDYAARRLSDKFVQAYMDKLDLVSKWVIIPRFITGKSLPETGKWQALLKGLVKERNSIVHSKSQAAPIGSKEKGNFYKKLHERNALIPQKARQAIELLDLLVVEISKLDPEEALWIQTYLK